MVAAAFAVMILCGKVLAKGAVRQGWELTDTHRKLSSGAGIQPGSSEGAPFSFLVKEQRPHQALAVPRRGLFYFTV